MAVSINISNITYKGAQINISGLSYYASNYSFRYRLENQWYDGSNNEWHEWSIGGSGSSYSFSYQMTGDEAYLTPHTNYTCKVYGLYGGTEYLLGTVSFTTSDVSRPSATQYLPSYIPQVLDQWVWDTVEETWSGEANCCVACSIASVLSILEYREKGTTNHQYSVSYIYGNRNLQGDAHPTSGGGTSTTELGGMYLDATMDQMKTDGTPVWTKVHENKNYRYPDNRFYEDDYNGTSDIGAQTVFHNARYNNLQIHAYAQCLNQRQNIHFYDSQAVANAIQTNGYYLFNFDIPNNFYSLDSTGIVQEPDDIVSHGGHTTVLIGWKTIDDVKYWIGLNSWGDWWWGDNGLFYLPMDWGASVAHVNNNANWLWAWMGYTASAKTIVQNTCPVKVWNGFAWCTCPTKRYNGVTWATVSVKIQK